MSAKCQVKGYSLQYNSELGVWILEIVKKGVSDFMAMQEINQQRISGVERASVGKGVSAGEGKMRVDLNKLLMAGGIKNNNRGVDRQSKSNSDIKALPGILNSSPEIILTKQEGGSADVVSSIDVYTVKFGNGRKTTLDQSVIVIEDKTRIKSRVPRVIEQLAILSSENGERPIGLDQRSNTDENFGENFSGGTFVRRGYNLEDPDVMGVVLSKAQALDTKYTEEKMSLPQIGEDLKRKNGLASKGEIFNAS